MKILQNLLRVSIFASLAQGAFGAVTAECGDILEGEFTAKNQWLEYVSKFSPGDSVSYKVNALGDTLLLCAVLREPTGNAIWNGGCSSDSDYHHQKEYKVNSGILSGRGQYSLFIHNYNAGVFTLQVQCKLKDGTEIAPGSKKSDGTNSHSQEPPRGQPEESASSDGTTTQQASLLKITQIEKTLQKLEVELASQRSSQDSLRIRVDEIESNCNGPNSRTGNNNLEHPPSHDKIVAYQDSNYRGTAEHFSADDPNLDDNLVRGNSASSIKVAPGCVAVLYSGKDYTGTSLIATDNIQNLRETAFGNDRLQSIKIRCNW